MNTRLTAVVATVTITISCAAGLVGVAAAAAAAGGGGNGGNGGPKPKPSPSSSPSATATASPSQTDTSTPTPTTSSTPTATATATPTATSDARTATTLLPGPFVLASVQGAVCYSWYYCPTENSLGGQTGCSAELLDSSGSPLAGEPVTFIAPCSGTATTNAAGVATLSGATVGYGCRPIAWYCSIAAELTRASFAGDATYAPSNTAALP